PDQAPERDAPARHLGSGTPVHAPSGLSLPDPLEATGRSSELAASAQALCNAGEAVLQAPLLRELRRRPSPGGGRRARLHHRDMDAGEEEGLLVQDDVRVLAPALDVRPGLRDSLVQLDRRTEGGV